MARPVLQSNRQARSISQVIASTSTSISSMLMNRSPRSTADTLSAKVGSTEGSTLPSLNRSHQRLRPRQTMK